MSRKKSGDGRPAAGRGGLPGRGVCGLAAAGRSGVGAGPLDPPLPPPGPPGGGALVRAIRRLARRHPRYGYRGLYRRQGKAVTNFTRTLPPPQSDLAGQALKDPYNFDFLTLAGDAHEREVQKGLLAHVRQFLLELGAGFAFVGEYVHLEVGGEDFYIDLLFYHLKLRAFLVVGLKVRPFEPEFAGKMNFYLSAVDDLLRHPDDKPSIGLILCKAGSRAVAEYA
jgi:predicted nuclease of restriction endonuclease-like (RecB) superfamily